MFKMPCVNLRLGLESTCLSSMFKMPCVRVRVNLHLQLSQSVYDPSSAGVLLLIVRVMTTFSALQPLREARLRLGDPSAPPLMVTACSQVCASEEQGAHYKGEVCG